MLVVIFYHCPSCTSDSNLVPLQNDCVHFCSVLMSSFYISCLDISMVASCYLWCALCSLQLLFVQHVLVQVAALCFCCTCVYYWFRCLVVWFSRHHHESLRKNWLLLGITNLCITCTYMCRWQRYVTWSMDLHTNWLWEDKRHLSIMISVLGRLTSVML